MNLKSLCHCKEINIIIKIETTLIIWTNLMKSVFSYLIINLDCHWIETQRNCNENSISFSLQIIRKYLQWTRKYVDSRRRLMRVLIANQRRMEQRVINKITLLVLYLLHLQMTIFVNVIFQLNRFSQHNLICDLCTSTSCHCFSTTATTEM